MLLTKIDKKIRHWNHRRIDLSRALTLKILNFILTPLSRYLKTSEAANSILVLRLDDKLGDSVTATGFLRELKRNESEKKLVVVAGPSSASVYQELKFIDEVFVLKKGFFSTVQLFFELNKRPYEVIINTSHILIPRSIFLSSLLKARRKISFKNSHVKLFSDHVDFNFESDHITMRYQKALQNIIGATKAMHIDLSYELFKDPLATATAKKILNQLNPQHDPIIILNSFAGGRLRNLRKETTFALVRELLKNEKVIILSIGNVGDLRIISEWIKEFNHPSWMFAADQGELKINLALLNEADLIITPDTAWVHLASALKKKIVAIYREDLGAEKNAKIWAPYQTEAQIIFAPAKPGEDPDVNSVNVQEVSRATFDLLNTHGK